MKYILPVFLATSVVLCSTFAFATKTSVGTALLISSLRLVWQEECKEGQTLVGTFKFKAAKSTKVNPKTGKPIYIGRHEVYKACHANKPKVLSSNEL